MQTEFKNRLQSVREKAERVYKFSNNIEEIRKEAIDELQFYADVIPEFFSYKNEAPRIKAMYKKLKNLDYIRNRVIPCIDVCTADCLYTDYFTGMTTFINQFINEVSSNGENIEKMEQQLQTAIQGDPLFIESLFGGKNNESREEELTDAVCNFEYFVNFRDSLQRMNKVVDEICAECTRHYAGHPHIIYATKLIANSTCMFSNRILNTMVGIYEDINNSLDDRPVTTTKHTTFKIF